MSTIKSCTVHIAQCRIPGIIFDHVAAEHPVIERGTVVSDQTSTTREVLTDAITTQDELPEMNQVTNWHQTF